MDTQAIIDAVASHAMRIGAFESVTTHEPKGAFTTGGLRASIWADGIKPVPLASGLAATSALLTLNLRIYLGMVTEPQESIDPEIVKVVDTLIGAYSGDFSLGGLIRNVDLLGAYGAALEARAGYLILGSPSTMYRVITIVLPLVINDAWTQAE